jgi:hypothetical protein
MDTIKTISITTFFVVLLASNVGIVIESLLVIFPPNASYSFAGNTNNKLTDLDDGTLAIAADKMNVFYIGVDNPITVAASGVSSKNISVTATDATIKKVDEGHYSVACNKPGKVGVTVTNKSTGKTKTVDFRVKRIPDPVVKLGNRVSCMMQSGVFGAQVGLVAALDNFDMDFRCNIQSYTLYYVRKRSDPVEMQGSGGRFTGMVRNAILRAKPGDQYTFTNVKVRCPGDVTGRIVNSLSFNIR